MAQWTQRKPHAKVNLLDIGGPCVVGFEGIPGVVFVVGPAVFGVVMGGSPGVVICVDFVVADIPGDVMGVDFVVVVWFCQQFHIIKIIIFEITYWL